MKEGRPREAADQHGPAGLVGGGVEAPIPSIPAASVAARPPGSGLRRAASAISLLWSFTILGAVLALVTQALLARRLGPAEYGVFAASLAIVALVAPLAGFGIPQYWLKLYGTEGWRADRWLRPSLRFVTGTSLVALGLVLAWAFIALSGQARLLVLSLSPVVLGLMAVGVVSSKLRLEERHGGLALWQILTPAGRVIVVAVLFASPSLGSGFVAAGYSVVALIVTGVAFTHLRAMARGRMTLKGHGPAPAIGEAGSGSSSEVEVISAMSVGARASAYGVAGVLYSVFFQANIVLLKYLAGDEAAGMFAVALGVMTAVYLLPSTIYQKFLLSKLHRWATHDKAKFRRVYRAGGVAMLGLGLVVGLGVFFIARPLVPTIFGAEFESAAGLLAILALCAPLRFLMTAVGSALLSEQQTRLKVVALAAGTVGSLGVGVLLIPRYGDVGAAWATVTGEALLLISTYAVVRKVAAGIGETQAQGEASE